MYLLSVDPGSDVATFHNPFGRYTRLLYLLAGSDVARFRALGAAVLVAVAALLGERLAALAGRLARRQMSGPVRLAAAGAVVGAALHYYLLQLVTPSYNWLNLVGILAILAGMAHELGRREPGLRRQALDQCFVGLVVIGAAAATMGKISSGPPLFVAALAAVLLAVDADRAARRHTTRSYAAWAAAALAAHWLLANPPPTTLAQLRRGQRSLVLLDPAYGLGRAAHSVLDAANTILSGLPERLALAGGLCLVASAATWLAAGAATGRRSTPEVQRAVRVLAPALVAVAVLALQVQLLRAAEWKGSSVGYARLAWVGVTYAGLALATAPLAGLRLAAGRVPGSGRRAAVFVLIASLGACSYAFGSNNGFFQQLNGGLTPLVAATVLVLLLVPDPSRLAVPTVALSLAMGIGAWRVIDDAEARPYRQLALRHDTASFELSDGRGTLLLPPALAATFEQLRTDAQAAGWRPGTPMLDLSAYAAGIPFILAADAPITIIPSVAGFGGQQELAIDSIEQLIEAGWAPRWRDAWVLTLANGPQPGVDPAVLGRLGRTFPQAYDRIGAYYLVGRQETVELWKPRATATLATSAMDTGAPPATDG